MQTKHLLTLALVAVACGSQAKSFVLPHVLEKSGTILGVSMDIEGACREAGSGLATGRRQYQPLIIRCSAEGSSGMIDETIRCFTRPIGSVLASDDWKVHRIGSGNDRCPVFSLTGGGITSFACPTLDGSSKEAGYLKMEIDVDHTFDLNADVAPTRAESEAVRKQKAWMCSNFRVSIGNLPASRISKIDSFTIKQSVADLDGDGVLDLDMSDGAITLDYADAAPYLQWLQESMSSSKPITKMIKIDVNNNAGQKLFSVTAEVQPVGISLTDAYEDFAPTLGSSVQFRYRKTGHVTLLK